MFLLPQELQDNIFMYLDSRSRVITRELQSPFIQKYTDTQYSSLDEAIINGSLYNVKFLIEQGEILHTYLLHLAEDNKEYEILKYFEENRTNYSGIDKAYKFYKSENGHICLNHYLYYLFKYKTKLSEEEWKI